MAICNIFETPRRTPEELERLDAHLRTTGPIPPEGCRLVLIGSERASPSGTRRPTATASWRAACALRTRRSASRWTV
jgi:hypothetical protein